MIPALRRILLGLGLSATAAVMSSVSSPVQAADVTAVPPAMPAAKGQEDWYLTLGVSGRIVPQYPGSDDYGVRPGLVFRVAKASGLNAFRSVDDNPSVALFDTGTFRVGAVGRIDWGRDEDANDRLTGLGNVDPSLELGGFTEWFPVSWLRLRGELRYGFGGYEGWLGNAAADLIVPMNDWRFAVGPRLSFASSAFNEAYFGVTPFQSLSATFLGNPLPVYNAGSGINGWGRPPSWSAISAMASWRASGAATDASSAVRRILRWWRAPTNIPWAFRSLTPSTWASPGGDAAGVMAGLASAAPGAP